MCVYVNVLYRFLHRDNGYTDDTECNTDHN